jgi:hypothetical protein
MPPDVVSLMLNRQDEIVASIDGLRGEIQEIKETLAEQKGARRIALYFLTTVSAFIGAAVNALLSHVWAHR